MRHDQRAAGKILQRLLEHPERDQVEIVGRLVENEQIAAAAEQPRQLHAVALAARERADGRVGEAIVEQHHAQEGAHVDRPVVEEHVVVAVGDLLEHRLVVAQRRPRLIEVREACVDADHHLALVGCKLPEQRAHQRRLAGTVGSDDADAIARLERERQAAEQPAPVRHGHALAHVLELEDGLADAPARRQPERHQAGALVVDARRRRHRRIEAIDARLLLGAARLRPAPDPVQLTPHEPAPRLLARRLARQPIRLLLEKIRIAADVRVEPPAIELQDARRHAVEKVTIVRHQQQRPRPLARQVVLEPRHRLAVEVVGRLVERQQRRPRQQRPRQRHAPPLAARQRRDGRLQRRQLQRRRQRAHLVIALPAARRLEPRVQPRLLLERRLQLVARQRVNFRLESR